MFLEAWFDKGVAFCHKYAFHFSRKSFQNPVKFYILKNVIFHIVKSLLLTIESSKDSLFTGQLFQGIKLENSQEYQEDETRIGSRVKNQGKKETNTGKKQLAVEVRSDPHCNQLIFKA